MQKQSSDDCESSDDLQNQHFPKVCNADGLHLGKWSPSFHLFLFQRTFSIYKPLQNANIENFEMKCKFKKGLQPLVKSINSFPSATWEEDGNKQMQGTQICVPYKNCTFVKFPNFAKVLEHEARQWKWLPCYLINPHFLSHGITYLSS